MVFFIFGLGLYMVELSYYDAWYKGSLDLHKSLGVITAILLLLRVTWRVISIRPNDLTEKEWERKIAHWVHLVLYAGLFFLLLMGFFISTANGQPIMVFEILEVPAMPWQIENQEDIAGEIHEILAWFIILMTAIHALAALKHHFISKNDVLRRMLKSKKLV